MPPSRLSFWRADSVLGCAESVVGARRGLGGQPRGLDCGGGLGGQPRSLDCGGGLGGQPRGAGLDCGGGQGGQPRGAGLDCGGGLNSLGGQLRGLDACDLRRGLETGPLGTTHLCIFSSQPLVKASVLMCNKMQTNVVQ